EQLDVEPEPRRATDGAHPLAFARLDEREVLYRVAWAVGHPLEPQLVGEHLGIGRGFRGVAEQGSAEIAHSVARCGDERPRHPLRLALRHAPGLAARARIQARIGALFARAAFL